MTISRVGAISLDLVKVPATSNSLLHTVISGTTLLVYAAAMQANRSFTSIPQFDGDDMVLIRDGNTDTSASSIDVGVWGIVAPIAKTANIVVTWGNGSEPMWTMAMNFTGGVITSVADAVQLLDEQISNTNSNNINFPLGGDAGVGNGLIVVCGIASGDVIPISNNAGYEELIEDATGPATNSADLTCYVAFLEDNAPSAIDIFLSNNRRYCSYHLELISDGIASAPVWTTNPPDPVDGQVGQVYPGHDFQADVDVTSTFIVAAGSLPSGLSLASNGLLTGTPDTFGLQEDIRILASAAGGDTASFAFDLGILAAGTGNFAPINDVPMPNQVCTINVPFGPLDIDPFWSGQPDPTYTQVGLPNGLVISSAGVISGTPTGGFQTDPAPPPPPNGGISPEVQAVFDRMSALNGTEQGAIEAFVDGLVLDGVYASITEIFAPCLNATDFETGFKIMTLIPSATTPAHTPGEYVDYGLNAMHHMDSDLFSNFAVPQGFIGAYVVFTSPDVATSSDLFGVSDAGSEVLYRWRGNDTNDFEEDYMFTSLIPQTVANERPEGDIVGLGADGEGNALNLQPGGVIDIAARISTGAVPKQAMQWHGQNIDGVPSTANVQDSRYSLMFHSNNITEAQILIMRARSLQFLRDIGVTGIPAT